MQSLFTVAGALAGSKVRVRATKANSQTASRHVSISENDGQGASDQPDEIAEDAPRTSFDLDAIMDKIASGQGNMQKPHEQESGFISSGENVEGTVVVRPTVTLIFSKMKDFVLGRGEERTTGGRRRVIREAIDELCAAHKLAFEYERLLVQLLAIHSATSDKVLAESSAWPVSSGRLSRLWSTLTHVVPVTSRFHKQVVADHPGKDDISPWLRHAAAGGLTLARLSGLPLSISAWSSQIARDRREEAAFPRRLHLYAAINLIRTRGLLKATGRCFSSLYFCMGCLDGSDEHAAAVIRRFMLHDDPRGTLRLAAWMCHDRDVRRKRAESLTVFDRKRFRYEMETMLNYFVVPVNNLRHFTYYILAWEAPGFTASVFILLLLVIWHNMLPYALPIVLSGHALGILAYGATTEENRSALATMFGRERTAKARNIIEQLWNFRTALANNQFRMHRLNEYVLKIRSLYTWRDPPRTRLYLVALLVALVVFSLIPARWLFTALVLQQFTKAFRKKGGLTTVAMRRFWDGLPVPSLSDPVYMPVNPQHVDDNAIGLQVMRG